LQQINGGSAGLKVCVPASTASISIKFNVQAKIKEPISCNLATTTIVIMANRTSIIKAKFFFDEEIKKGRIYFEI
jgi:hypothetical protein